MTRAGAPRAQRTGWGAAIDVGGAAGGGAIGGRGDPAPLVDRADEPADYGRWARRWTWPVLLAAAVALGMSVGGVDLWRAVTMAAGVSVAMWAVIASMTAPRISWHDDVPGQRFPATSSWEVPGLTAARESDVAFGYYLRPRLWSLAEELLRARGIDPAGHEARELMGPRLYDVLTGANTDSRAVTSSVSAICRSIARLAVDPTFPGRPPVDTPALAGLAGAPRTRRQRRSQGRRDGHGTMSVKTPMKGLDG